MIRKISVALVAILLASALHVAGVSAQSTTVVGQNNAVQTPTCTNAEFLTGVGEDFTAFATVVKDTKMDDISALSQTILATAATRQKYEDLNVELDCLPTQLAVIIAFANGSDLLSLQLASLTDTNKDNATLYADALKAQAERFTKSAETVVSAIGMPAAEPTAAS